MASQIFQFIMKAGPVPGKKFILDKSEIFIGRDISSNVLVNDAEVSRKHARLLLQAGGYVIEDLGSTNGTFVNEQRLVGLRTLLPGDTITIGDNVSLIFEVKQPDLDATRVSTTVPAAGSTQPSDQSASPVSPPAPTRKTWQPDEPSRVEQPFSEPVVVPSPVLTPQKVVQVPRETVAASTAAPLPSRGVQPGKPEVYEPSAPAPTAKKRSGPKWLLIGVISLLIFLCMIVFGGLWYIDSHYLWCNVLPFLPACG